MRYKIITGYTVKYARSLRCASGNYENRAHKKLRRRKESKNQSQPPDALVHYHQLPGNIKLRQVSCYD